MLTVIKLNLDMNRFGMMRRLYDFDFDGFWRVEMIS